MRVGMQMHVDVNGADLGLPQKGRMHLVARQICQIFHTGRYDVHEDFKPNFETGIPRRSPEGAG